MRKKIVIDTGALLTLFFAGDDRVGPYFRRVQEAQTEGYVASTTLAEFHYKVCQKLGLEPRDFAIISQWRFQYRSNRSGLVAESRHLEVQEKQALSS